MLDEEKNKNEASLPKDSELRSLDKKTRKCMSCGGRMLYSPMGDFICSVCGRKEQDDYDKVWDYINEYGPSSVYVIHIATGVPEDVIVEMINQGRIGSAETVEGLHKCERCGSEIKSGRLCLTCMKKEAAKLKTEFSEKKNSDRNAHGTGMRYFGKQHR